jgi:plasmid stability protein
LIVQVERRLHALRVRISVLELQDARIRASAHSHAFSDCIAIIGQNPGLFQHWSPAVASITIRNLDDDIKQRLRVRAAEHGRSMEEEARDILRRVMTDAASPRDLAAAIRARVTAAARAELKLPARDPLREPPQLGRQPR